MKQTTRLWGIERKHPKSTSIMPDVFGRTRKEARAAFIESYERIWRDTERTTYGKLLAEACLEDGRAKVVPVDVTWGEP